MKSISRRFLISVGIMSLVVTIFSTLGAFVVFQRELSNRQIGYLEDYVRELPLIVILPSLDNSLGCDMESGEPYERFFLDDLMAHVESTFLYLNQAPGELPQVIAWGRYIDQFRREGGVWRIAARCCVTEASAV